ncbi:uncharacterized protein LOC117640224 isoform X1 [Thrips palmi]|uniref:Uncharacterized protein LOC117640224 isoform X1 n=1 Tax=Thrips palmi TaxID=161013 RepID=A0A6P8ZHU1_THRPL|nr:uncharacterized protein LOC117640224 isoform X1 [Thrips palmi]XP_034232445.1 uncharacterized protein LOC117640224 isoform X1 [Thrips palmi]XP_034232446.1 uncharacterized protein LOC117640224 isoform X1 [Thrips palmi]
MSSLMWPTPFWYNGSLSRPGRPVGDANDYNFCKLAKSSVPVAMVEKMELDDPSYYIPGQVGKLRQDKQSYPHNRKKQFLIILQLSVTAANEGHAPEPNQVIQDEPPVQNKRRPLYERRIIPLRPPQEHYQLSPWIGQDKRSLERVGSAFRTDVCNGHYTLYPPGPQPAITLRRCDYPDIRLSVL